MLYDVMRDVMRDVMYDVTYDVMCRSCQVIDYVIVIAYGFEHMTM